MSSNPEALRKPPLEYVEGTTTTIAKMLGGPVGEPKNSRIGQKPTGIEHSPALVFAESRLGLDESVFTMVINDSLSGKRLNQVYWEVAPGNAFQLDYDDIVSDHTSLLLKPDQHQRLVVMHEQSGSAWKRFRRYGAGELDAIRKDTKGLLYPVLRWQNMNGTRKFVYSHRMHTDESKSVINRFLGEDLSDSSDRTHLLDPVLGLYILAMYSPEIKNDWPKRDSLYEGGTTREIGSTQAPLNVLMKEDSLLAAPLLQAAEDIAMSS